LRGEIKIEIEEIIRMYSAKLGCEVDKLSIQEDHVHLLVMVSPKVSLSEYIGTIKGRSAIRLFSRFPWLRQKPYWGNHFWARGYCLDTVGLDVEKIRKYVMYQEKIEKQLEIRG
jgi:putative transposase